MKPLHLYSEPYPPTGASSGVGVRNQLGRFRHHPIEILIREAAQNSNDARAAADLPVRFAVDGWRATKEHARSLRSHLASEAIPSETCLTLPQVLSVEPLTLLCISDRGTTGLMGPTRADVIHNESEPRDFVDFVRNIGQPPDKPLGGGTFGYGKGIFYLMSEASSIIVYTRCVHDARSQSRLIACALAQGFVRNGLRHTGRHWWGRLRHDVVEPAVDRDADDIAAAIGLPPFGGNDLGTTIAIVAPRFDDLDPEAAMRFAIDCMLWNLWPKMLPGLGQMAFSASWQHKEIPVPRPENHARLAPFVEAYRRLHGAQGSLPALEERQAAVAIERPRKHLGKLCVAKVLRPPPAPVADSNISEGPETAALPLNEPLHHVALMRPARLVVKYLDCIPAAAASVEYAGVFIADEDVNDAFAKAEPPTHDDWIPEALSDRTEKSLVRVALRNIRDIAENFIQPLRPSTGTGLDVPLGYLAHRLGALLPGSQGTAPSPATSRRGSGPLGGGGRKPRLSVMRRDLKSIDGNATLLVTFSVEHVDGTPGSLVRAYPRVALDGNAIETEPPTGAEVPRVRCWRLQDGTILSESAEALLPGSIEQPVELLITLPSRAAVTATLSAEVAP